MSLLRNPNLKIRKYA